MKHTKSSSQIKTTLSAEDKLFCQEVLKHGNKRAAFALCYPANKNPAVGGYELFNRPRIQAELERLQKSAAHQADIDAAWIAKEHKGFYEECRAAGDTVGATRNLELLGKTVGAYTDNLKIAGSLSDVDPDELDERIRQAAAEIEASAAAGGKGQANKANKAPALRTKPETD